VAGKARELFSVVEDNKGMITLRIRSGARVFEGEVNSGPITETHKISLHPSNNSPAYNLIHMTQTVAGRENPIESHLLTNAVKMKAGFCQIYVRRCMNLNADWFLPQGVDKATTEVVTIDVHNHQIENLIHSVVIGAPDAVFQSPDSRVLVTERTFSKFKIIVLHSRFFLMPAAPTGNFIYLGSIDTKKHEFPNDDFKQEFDRLMEGQPAATCVDEFWLGAMSLMEQFCHERLVDTKHPPPGILHDHLVKCLERFSTEANALCAKVRPALIAYYRDPRFLGTIIGQSTPSSPAAPPTPGQSATA
jgi:hypothetical protein